MMTATQNEPLASEPARGFLPAEDPLTELRPEFAPWEEIGRALPKLLAAGRARGEIERLPMLDAARIEDGELERAMLVLSFLGHAALWEGHRGSPAPSVPRGVAVPWVKVAKRLGRPPVLSYASHILANWRRLDADGPVALGNLAALLDFYGGLDEDWFVLVHVAIEASAAPGVSAILAGQTAARDGNLDALLEHLRTLRVVLEGVHQTLSRLPERCAPFIFYNRLQPFLHGFQNILYEGVGEGAGQSMSLLGGSAAQSVFVPLVDAALGIVHAQDSMITYLQALRIYMPPAHRAMLERIEGNAAIRAEVLRNRQNHPALVAAYNECIDWVRQFREVHIRYAAEYIHLQAKGQTETGTGGTPFMKYLKKHLEESTQCQIT